ncbi:hypothetical protein L3Q82_015660 [Scortum barcoo]|uniref:Uncharacterized protein n=1 Tax=Scortum barcoo TaxID=214431 RepID=A0ACB8VP62_9TELE|nr:hypothetical protein L3Q82_015660 [Scortum barcoo]
MLHGKTLNFTLLLLPIVIIFTTAHGCSYPCFSRNDTEFQHLVLHPDPSVGMVYVGARDHLFQLDGSDGLRLEQEEMTGPVRDSKDCLPPVTEFNCPQARITSNHNKLLLVDPKTLELITCGSIHQGTCQKRSLASIKNVLFFSERPVDTQYVAANDPLVSTVGLVVELQDREKTVMYVGRGYTASHPPICTRHLSSEPLFSYEETAKLAVAGRLSEYDHHFVMAFTWRTYVFFLFYRRDIKSALREYRTYAARVCLDDTSYYSYVEVPLVCQSPSSPSRTYNLLQAAQVGHGSGQEGGNLLGVFSTRISSSNNNLSEASALCVYSMDDLDRHMDSTRDLCYTQDGLVEGKGEVAYIEYEVKSSCANLPINTLKAYPCGADHTPSPMASRASLEAKAVWHTSAARLTAVAVSVREEHSIAFLGDSKGTLHKRGAGPSTTAVRLKKESYRAMLACGTPDAVDRYRQTMQASMPRSPDGPGGKTLGSGRSSMMLSCWLSSSQDLQHVLERFAAECEAAGMMRISTSKSEAMVLDWKRVACPLRVGGEVLPQVYLGQDGQVEVYANTMIQPNSAINRDLLLDQNGAHIYIMTETTVEKRPVAECGQHLDCHSCLSARDPYCGWCVLEGRCDQRWECQRGSVQGQWLWSFNKMQQCLNIQHLSLYNISHGEKTDIAVSVEGLPSLGKGEAYSCFFQDTDSPAFLTNSGVICSTPDASRLPPIGHGDHFVMVTLSLRFINVTVAETEFTFYNCSLVQQLSGRRPCQGCVSSTWGCNWCIHQHVCTHKHICSRGVTIYNQNVLICHQECPWVEKVQESSLLPVNVERKISLVGKHLNLFQDENLDYECVLDIENQSVVVDASVEPDATQQTMFFITCQPHQYAYSALIDEYSAMISVRRRNNFLIDSAEDLYAGRSDCSRCRTANPKYGCVWCGGSVSSCCVYQDSCTDEIRHTCPAPVIHSLDPLSGPIEGGTLVTISGSNLGQRAEDIQNSVTVAGVPCSVVHSRYEVSSRQAIGPPENKQFKKQNQTNLNPYFVIVTTLCFYLRIVCETTRSDREKSGQASVEVRGGGLGLSGQIFSFQDPVLSSIFPQRGPKAGGSFLTIRGHRLKTGHPSEVSFLIGGVPCMVLNIQEDQISCLTRGSNRTGEHGITVRFGGAERHLQGCGYHYTPNPNITMATPSKSFLSGGRIIRVSGQNLDVVQEPKMRVTLSPPDSLPPRRRRSINVNNEGSPLKRLRRIVPEADCPKGTLCLVKQYESRCTMNSSSLIFCLTPAVGPEARKARVKVNFLLDSLHFDFSTVGNEAFSYEPNPQLYPLNQNDPSKPYYHKPGSIISVEGENLDLAIYKHEVEARIGEGVCSVKTLTHNHLYCEPPVQQPPVTASKKKDGMDRLPEFTVKMGNLNFSLGRVQYDNQAQTTFPLEAQVGVGVAASIVALVVLIIVLMYSSRMTQLWWDGSANNDESDYRQEVEHLEGWCRQNNLCINVKKTKEMIVDFRRGRHLPSPLYIGGTAVMHHEGPHSHHTAHALFVPLLSGRRKSKQAMRDYKKVQIQLENLETSVRDRCKKEFTDLMTEMMDMSSDLVGSGIPLLDYRAYAERIFFPGHQESPLIRDLDVPESRRQTVEQGLVQLSNLLNSKLFLIKFIHTLEVQRTFSPRDRAYVASLLTVALHGKLEYFTDILKTLLNDLVEQCVAKNPKLMLRRTESVVEKLLTNWMSICLFAFLRESAGESFYMLFRAIKHQVDKGPVDAVTGKAKYTLNDNRLLQEDVEYRTLTLNVVMPAAATSGGTTIQTVPAKVLDCDTITQVKEKLLEQTWKGTSFSQRPRIDSLNLEWRAGVAGHLILSDEDLTSVVRGSWKRLNTLQHYKVPDGAMVALIPRSTKNHLSGSHDYMPGESKSESWTTMLDDGEEGGVRLWHLVKPSEESELPKHRRGSVRERNGERAKAIPEIYLTRLLSMKGTLQKFVDDLFTAILSTSHPVPLAVKYFFDLLDEQALQHNITDYETIHIWKTNSLPLRFWINILKNPQFIFDVQASDHVDAVLSVIAQTFMDSCTIAEHKLGRDSPINKLLYARDIPRYKQMVERYYADIRQTISASDQDMNSALAELSRNYAAEVNCLSALHELHKYINKYYDQIITALEEDSTAQKMQLGYRLQQVAAAVENKVTDL